METAIAVRDGLIALGDAVQAMNIGLVAALGALELCVYVASRERFRRITDAIERFFA